ncbi:hypothetical protein JD844_009830 [Phrynosoma platyrhinos]|uniref:Ig-like domain-containing protein n=1 Tax=Phrynosoma platyrhinos TaxID=52577 RepID=A0ABQ7TGH0_PHRPL|nr:hypothetical protein JD844_009830 [Phrynosoma platyrhinos]
MSLTTEAMWREVVSVLCLQLLAGFCSGVSVTQKERFKIIQVGTKTSLDCNHNDITYYTILWYRQDSNSAETQLQLVGYSVQGNDPQMTMTTYSIERPNMTHASLSVPPVQAEDSAVYFCAAAKSTVSTSCLKAAHECWNSPASTLSEPQTHTNECQLSIE